MITLKAYEGANGRWRVGYDGVISGDDRQFDSEELANQEIAKRMKKDARDAVIYDRDILYRTDAPSPMEMAMGCNK